MHFRHIFPGQDKAVPSFGEAVEEWKPPDKIYTIDNTILHYMLGFFFFLFLFPPSTALSLLFNPSSFLIIFSFFLFILFIYFSFHIFSHIIFSSFLIIIQLKNAIYILIQLIQCTCVHQATEVNALIRQFNNAIQLITQLSLKSLQIQVSHQSLIQCTWYIKPPKLIGLSLQMQSLRSYN